MDDRSSPPPSFLKEAHGVLMRRRDELAERTRRVDSDLHREHEPLVADFADQAIQRENEDVLREIGATSRAQLRQVNQALERLQSGQYLNCSHCGGDIGEARLRAIPETTLCAACAMRQSS
jgi:DnaK suppressor protein